MSGSFSVVRKGCERTAIIVSFTTAARLATFGLDASAPLAAVVCECEDGDVGFDRLESALADAEVVYVAAVKTREDQNCRRA